MSPLRRRLVIGVVTLGGIVLGCSAYVAYRVAVQTKTTTFRISYEKMPADDEAFTKWLRSQPGVTEATVARRATPPGNRPAEVLQIVFVMPARSTDPDPDVLRAAQDFGYAGHQGTFTDTELASLFSWCPGLSW